MSEREQRCKTCRWWSRQGNDPQEAECRRRPPVVSDRRPWPTTRPNDWCGDWQERPKPWKPGIGKTHHANG